MKTKSKQFYLLGLIAAFIVMLYGCYPKGPEYTSDYSLVVTDYDPEFDFGAQKTYYMPDTVYLETNDENPDADRIREFQEIILGTIETNMATRDYQRIDTAGALTPDFVLSVSALAIDNTGVGWVPSPCWSWWCWYYPVWYPVGYSYSTGTVIIQMGKLGGVIDFEEDEANLHWIAGLDGLMSSNVNNNQAAVERGINQAFEQSPYFKSNR